MPIPSWMFRWWCSIHTQHTERVILAKYIRFVLYYDRQKKRNKKTSAFWKDAVMTLRSEIHCNFCVYKSVSSELEIFFFFWKVHLSLYIILWEKCIADTKEYTTVIIIVIIIIVSLVGILKKGERGGMRQGDKCCWWLNQIRVIA
jgi:hypothetical protein